MDFPIKAILVICLLCRVYVQSAPRQPRLSLAEPMQSYYYRNIEGKPNTYSFNYEVSDPATGNIQFRTEERYPNGTVAGVYGYIDAFGTPQRFQYTADKGGYRVFQDQPNRPNGYGVQAIYTTNNPASSTEPSVSWTRPKRPNKNKLNTAAPAGIERRNYVDRQNRIAPPSYYIPNKINTL